MSDLSAIEWTDATWNPVTGCSKVSRGCKNCYAERDWVRLSANPRAIYFKRLFTDVQCHPERLNQPFSWTKPRRIFVNSMSDLFHEDVPDRFIDQVFFVMARAKNHVFQILTKRPARMLGWLTEHGLNSVRYGEGEDVEEQQKEWPWPLRNVWLGVSVEDQATADERTPLLMRAPAAVRWISAEPLLGPIDLLKWEIPGHQIARALSSGKGEPCLHWVVTGGESGPKARPSHPDWFRSLRDQCMGAGVPFFFKQWGSWKPMPFWDSLKYRGAAIDEHGNPPPLEALDQLMKGDTTPLIGRVHMSFVGKKAAGRLLDRREWNEYPQ